MPFENIALIAILMVNEMNEVNAVNEALLFIYGVHCTFYNPYYISGLIMIMLLLPHYTVCTMYIIAYIVH